MTSKKIFNKIIQVGAAVRNLLGQEGATLRKFLRKKWRDNEIRAPTGLYLLLKAVLEPDKRLGYFGLMENRFGLVKTNFSGPVLSPGADGAS